jgi:hypothetical protein
MRTDHKSIEIQSSDQYLFALLGAAHLKAAFKDVGEIDLRPLSNMTKIFLSLTLLKQFFDIRIMTGLLFITLYSLFF